LDFFLPLAGATRVRGCSELHVVGSVLIDWSVATCQTPDHRSRDVWERLGWPASPLARYTRGLRSSGAQRRDCRAGPHCETPSNIRTNIALTDLISSHLIELNISRLQQIFCACCLWSWLDRSSSGGVAIHYALPVLCMLLCFHIMDPVAACRYHSNVTVESCTGYLSCCVMVLVVSCPRRRHAPRL